MVEGVTFVDEIAGSPLGMANLVGSPLKLSKTPMDNIDPPPFVGQHTDEILGDLLALTDSEIADLRENNIIR